MSRAFLWVSGLLLLALTLPTLAQLAVHLVPALLGALLFLAILRLAWPVRRFSGRL